MTSMIGTLLWWNRGADAAALFWHQAALHARKVMVDELGDVCRIAVIPAAGTQMLSLLPLDLAFLEHGQQPERLRVGLANILAGARGVRILAVGAVDSAELFAVAREVFRPDIVAGPEAIVDARCPDALRPTIQSWQTAFAERASRLDTIRRYRIDEVVSGGLPEADPEARLSARIAPGRQACFVLPGSAAGSVRLILDLAAGSAVPRRVWLRLNDRELDAISTEHSIETFAYGLAPAPAHILEIGHTALDDVVLAGISIGPA